MAPFFRIWTQKSYMYQYRANVIKIVDGDTLDVEIDLGFYIKITQRVRLLGINTSEIYSKDPAERLLAQQAKDFSTKMVMGQSIILESHKPYADDKYGRFLAKVLVNDNILNEELLKAGLAKPYPSK